MSENMKVFALQCVRKEFIEFLGKIASLPCAPVQKQQAFLKFDEAHMWLQAGIAGYEEEKKVDDEQASEAEKTE